MLDKLIKFIRKNYIQIIIVIIIISIIDRSLSRKEFYDQLGGCVPYTILGRSVPYRTCQEYGYVVPTDNLKSIPIKIHKCKIGVPADTMKYKIIIDDIERYSKLLKFQPMGHVVGSTLRFDNNKEYKIISTDPNVVM